MKIGYYSVSLRRLIAKEFQAFQTGGAVVENLVAFAIDGKECAGIAAGKVFSVFEVGR
jgi:hypothetical protein